MINTLEDSRLKHLEIVSLSLRWLHSKVDYTFAAIPQLRGFVISKLVVMIFEMRYGEN